MITKELITKYTIEPSVNEEYIYYLQQGENGNIYNFGVSDSSTALAGGQVYEANSFMNLLKLFHENEIGIVELKHLKMRISNDQTSQAVNQEIFSLSEDDVVYIATKFDPVLLVEKLGLFSLAQVLLIAGVFGNLATQEGSTAALGVMAQISAYWIEHKGSSREGIIKDASTLKAYLEENLSYSTEETNSLLSLFTQKLDSKLSTNTVH